MNTVGTVWLGLTVGCAQCHDHKFDPITQKEFYQLFAFFGNVNEKGVYTETRGNVPPLVKAVSPEDEKKLAEFDTKIAAPNASIEPSTAMLLMMPMPTYPINDSPHICFRVEADFRSIVNGFAVCSSRKITGITNTEAILHAAPINIGAGLKKHLFEKVKSVVLTSATLCTAAPKSDHGRGAHATMGAGPSARGTGASPVVEFDEVKKRRGAYLPHWTKDHAI